MILYPRFYLKDHRMLSLNLSLFFHIINYLQPSSVLKRSVNWKILPLNKFHKSLFLLAP